MQPWEDPVTQPVESGHRPDYPPKTPPPPKKPISPPPPEPAALVQTGRRPVNMINRRGASWPLEAKPRAVPGARRRVVEQLQKWGHHANDETVGPLVAALFNGVLGSNTTTGRISLHVTDQDGCALIVAVSHQPDLGGADEMLLHRITNLSTAVTSCGTDTDQDGRHLWAVIDLTATKVRQRV